MAEYIKRADVLEHFTEFSKYTNVDTEYKRGCNEVFDYYKKIVENVPTADAVEVVRCKDCKYCEERHYEETGEKPYIKLVCKWSDYSHHPNDFCSYGKRRENGT